MLIRDTDPRPAKPITVGLNQYDDDHIGLMINDVRVIDMIELDGKVSLQVRNDIGRAHDVLYTNAAGRLIVTGNVSVEQPTPQYTDEQYEERAMELGAESRVEVAALVHALKRGMTD